jgi:hypothetical protein
VETTRDNTKNLVYSEFWNQESETGGVKPSKFVTERNLKAAATNYDQISKGREI